MNIYGLFLLGVISVGLWKYLKKIIIVKNELDNIQPTIEHLEEESKKAFAVYNESYSHMERKFNLYSKTSETILKETIAEHHELKDTVNQIMSVNAVLYLRFSEITEIFKNGDISENNPLVINLLESIDKEMEKNKYYIDELSKKVEERNQAIEKSASKIREIHWGIDI